MSPKILLVDDREDNLLSMEAILKPDGYEFTMAYSGSDALKILNKESDFAMILMDVKMPILSGFETASLIYERETLKHIPIIFITANYYGEENLFKGFQSGGIDYIFKPINPEVLRAKVSIFIDLYRKNRLLMEQDQKLLEVNRKLASEIEELKASRENFREINDKLRKKIADLESIMAVSNIPVEKSEFANIDLNLLLQNLLNDMQEDVKSATISVGKLPCAYISPRLMRPLFKNLIRNALLSPQKNINPIIRIHSDICPCGEADGHENTTDRFCRIFVENNCNGFHSDVTPEGQAGLCDQQIGLALFQKIMEHHNGHFSTETQSSKGSTYILSLPILDNQSA